MSNRHIGAYFLLCLVFSNSPGLAHGGFAGASCGLGVPALTGAAASVLAATSVAAGTGTAESSTSTLPEDPAERRELAVRIATTIASRVNVCEILNCRAINIENGASNWRPAEREIRPVCRAGQDLPVGLNFARGEAFGGQSLPDAFPPEHIGALDNCAIGVRLAFRAMFGVSVGYHPPTSRFARSLDFESAAIEGVPLFEAAQGGPGFRVRDAEPGSFCKCSNSGAGHAEFVGTSLYPEPVGADAKVFLSDYAARISQCDGNSYSGRTCYRLSHPGVELILQRFANWEAGEATDPFIGDPGGRGECRR